MLLEFEDEFEELLSLEFDDEFDDEFEELLSLEFEELLSLEFDELLSATRVNSLAFFVSRFCSSTASASDMRGAACAALAKAIAVSEEIVMTRFISLSST